MIWNIYIVSQLAGFYQASVYRMHTDGPGRKRPHFCGDGILTLPDIRSSAALLSGPRWPVNPGPNCNRCSVDCGCQATKPGPDVGYPAGQRGATMSTSQPLCQACLLRLLLPGAQEHPGLVLIQVPRVVHGISLPRPKAIVCMWSARLQPMHVDRPFELSTADMIKSGCSLAGTIARRCVQNVYMWSEQGVPGRVPGPRPRPLADLVHTGVQNAGYARTLH